MNFLMCLMMLGLVVGLAGVASNPAPYFGALGLVVAAGVGCGVLVGHGGPFLSLVLFLIYLGGMLVVFAYTAAMAAEPYPEGWSAPSVLVYVFCYLFVAGVASWCLWDNWLDCVQFMADGEGFWMLRGECGGVGMLYQEGGLLVFVGGWVLLLTLFVVLELVRGLNRGALRAV